MITAEKQDWKKVTKPARKLGVEGKIVFDDGVHINIHNAADTIFMNNEYQPDFFESYSEDVNEIILSYARLDKTFSKFRKSESVTLTTNDENSRVIIKSDRKSFTIPQLDIRDEKKELMDFSTEDSFTVERSDLKELIDDVSFVDAPLELHVTDGIIARAGNKTKGDYQAVFSREVSKEDGYKSRVQIDFIDDVFTAIKSLSDEFTFNIAEDMPLVIECAGDNFESETTIAPMVEQE